MGSEGEKSKIIIDSDWKAEAQAAKEQLAAEEKAAQQPDRQDLPAPTIGDLINLIATPAAMAIGGYQTPDGQTIPPDLQVAKYHIDLLEVLEAKTKGNISDEETKMLTTVLRELRGQFTNTVNLMMQASAGAGASTGAAPPEADG